MAIIKFYPSDEEIIISGMPISLSVVKDPNRQFFYAINAIIKSGIEEYDPNPSDAFIPTYCVLQGSRLSVIQDKNFRYYLEVYTNTLVDLPRKEVIFNGMPLATTINKRLILSSTNYTTQHEYWEMFIGGIPLTIERIYNKWYLSVIAAAITSSEFVEIPFGDGRVSTRNTYKSDGALTLDVMI